MSLISLLKQRYSNKTTQININELLSTRMYVITKELIDIKNLNNGQNNGQNNSKINILGALDMLKNKNAVLKKDLYLNEDLWVVDDNTINGDFINNKRYILNPHLINRKEIKGLNTELDNVQSNKKKTVLPNLSGGAQLTINGDFCAMLNTLKSNIIMNGGASDNFTIHELLNNGKINLKESDRNRINLIVNKSVKYNERASMIYKYIEQYNKLPEKEKKGDIKQNVDANMEFLEEKILKDQEKSKLINTGLFDYLIKILNNNKPLKKNTVEYKEKKISMKNKIEELTDHFNNLGHIMKYNFQLIKDRQTKNVLRSTQQTLDGANRALDVVQAQRNEVYETLSNTQQDLSNTRQDLSNTQQDLSNTRQALSNTRQALDDVQAQRNEELAQQEQEREQEQERKTKKRSSMKIPISLESNSEEQDRQKQEQDRQKQERQIQLNKRREQDRLDRQKRRIQLNKRLDELKRKGNKLESERDAIGNSLDSRWQRLDEEIFSIYDERKYIVKEIERLRKTSV